MRPITRTTQFYGTLDNATLADFLPAMDYDLIEADDRNELIKEMLEDTHFFQEYYEDYYDPSINTASEDLAVTKVLDAMATYILIAKDKEIKKEKELLHRGRMDTITKREKSMEGMAEMFVNGMDGMEKLIRNDKNIIMKPKDTIKKSDCEEIPELAELVKAINKIKSMLDAGHWKDREAKKVKRLLIELRKDQYTLRGAYKKPIMFNKVVKGSAVFQYDENTGYYDENNDFVRVSENRINLGDWQHCRELIKLYDKLRDSKWNELQDDLKYIVEDLEELINKYCVGKYEYYKDIIIWKVDKLSNTEIQQLLEEKHGKLISVQYISTLYNNNIPKHIAKNYNKEYREWHYTFVEKGEFKKCNRCGETKLATLDYFSTNKSSKDGLYSICKKCRNKK